MYAQNFPVINFFYKLYKSRKVTLIYMINPLKKSMLNWLPSGPFGRFELTEIRSELSVKKVRIIRGFCEF